MIESARVIRKIICINIYTNEKKIISFESQIAKQSKEKSTSPISTYNNAINHQEGGLHVNRLGALHNPNYQPRCDKLFMPQYPQFIHNLKSNIKPCYLAGHAPS